MKSFPQRSAGTSGFTLIEILVSLAVLGLMMIGVAQILNGAMSTALGAYKHMDADTQARTVLDRMASDISHIVKRPDVDYYFKKNTGNDQMAFYSESGGYNPSGAATSADSDVSLIGYMIAPMKNGVYNAGGTPQLVRLSKALTWNGYSSSFSSVVFNPFPTSITSNTITNTVWSNSAGAATSNNIASGQDPDYQVIGDQIFRLEYTFLVQTSPTGAYATGTGTPLTCTSGGFYDSPWSPTSTNANGLKDVTAIVVSIAVLDSKSQLMLGSRAPSLLTSAATALNDDKCNTANPLTYFGTSGMTNGYLPLSLWKANLAASQLGLPKEVWQQVRFYQRFCFLNRLQ
ncbi:MAG TPA: prepilin-type N-terminal cleavage/methylation domain-containing protein [Lacunisphaera sp.]